MLTTAGVVAHCGFKFKPVGVRDVMDKLGQVDVSTLHERVYIRLRAAISQGDFIPGEVLTIRTLAASLGTSAMPVREALRRLVAERALVQLPNRSIAVAPFTTTSFRELIRIRMSIEGLATRIATQKADAELATKLRAVNEKMRLAVRNKDVDGLLDANKTFHFTIYAAAEMPQLLEIIQGLWLRTGPYLRAAYRTVPGAPEHFLYGTRIHERVIEAIDDRAAQRASTNIALDIWFSARRFGPTMSRIYSLP
jgi:DNA-binding GntR family transcriptional regulator